MTTYQAPDAALFVMSNTLRGDKWGTHVYSKFAPSNIFDRASGWVVIRIGSDEDGAQRGNRSNRVLTVKVQAISADGEWCERASSRIYDLLNESGSQDRRGNLASTDADYRSIGTHSEWTFTTVTAGRAIRIEPNKEYGIKYFEYGYEFMIRMEDKSDFN